MASAASMQGAGQQVSMSTFTRRMTERKPKPPEAPAGKKPPADKAFDAWLERGLHQLFDDVSREPVPAELLKLIEEHRDK